MATAKDFVRKWKIDQVDESLGPTGLSVEPKSKFQIGFDSATGYYFQEKEVQGNVEWNDSHTDPLPLTTDIDPNLNDATFRTKDPVKLNINQEKVWVYFKEYANGTMEGPIKGIEVIVDSADPGGQAGRSATGGGDG